MKIDKTSIEIEFKCLINEEIYTKLLEEFKVQENIKAQTNYYFDTKDFKLKESHTVLRIRQKGEQYKLTSKTNNEVGLKENHVYLTSDDAKLMISKGFDASIINIPDFVYHTCSLTTYRVSFPFNKGKLFFDKSVYNNITDYEIEFEAENYDDGKKVFEDFLKDHNIKYIVPKSKFVRAFESK